MGEKFSGNMAVTLTMITYLGKYCGICIRLLCGVEFQ